MRSGHRYDESVRKERAEERAHHASFLDDYRDPTDASAERRYMAELARAALAFNANKEKP